MSGLEVERKWLVDAVPAGVSEIPGDEIEQGYLVIGDDGSEARVRRRADRHFLTVKAGRDLVRSEFEVELTAEQFEALWPATEGRRVQKVRRVLPADATPDRGGELMIEFDQYSGALDGLLVVEVEFPSEAAARSFRAPSWFGSEVTNDDSYKNRRLAVDGEPVK